MKIKKFFYTLSTLGVIGTPLVSTISCGNKDMSKDIAMIISTQNNPYFVALKKGAEAEAKKLGYNLHIYVSNDKQEIESNKIDDVILKGFKVLVLNGLDSEKSAVAAQKAIKKGIKVIAVDRSLDKSVKVWTTISSANQEGAKKLAQKTLKHLKDKSINNFDMLHLQGIQGEQNGIDRWNGVKSAIKQKTLTIKQIYEARANYKRAEGQTQTSTKMTAYPKIKWINADNDEMALGAIASLGKKAGDEVIITGFDGGPDAIEAVERKKMFGTVKQDATKIGVTSIHAAIEALGGKDYDDIKKGTAIKIPVIVITEENVSKFKK